MLEASPQRGDLVGERSTVGIADGPPRATRVIPAGADRRVAGGLVDLAEEEVREPGLALAGASFEADRERFGTAAGERVEDLFDVRVAVAVAFGA